MACTTPLPLLVLCMPGLLPDPAVLAMLLVPLVVPLLPMLLALLLGLLVLELPLLPVLLVLGLPVLLVLLLPFPGHLLSEAQPASAISAQASKVCFKFMMISVIRASARIAWMATEASCSGTNTTL
jgi:hypothetical protein